jgi:hypothetical protein
MKLLIEVDTRGIGDPMTADMEGRPSQLFIGSTVYTVDSMQEVRAGDLVED